MDREDKTPAGIARRLGQKRGQNAGQDCSSGPRGTAFLPPRADGGGWRRETFTLPRAQARQKARDWFDGYPKAAYMTEIEFWQELPDDMIAFTIRRLPSAD